MGDFLTKRNGYWQFVRRVPLEYTKLDPRGVIKHSTKVPVAKDRRGVKAGRIAEAMNRELEAYWRGLGEGKAQEAKDRYDEARRRARTFGYTYAEMADLVANHPTHDLLGRLEKLVSTGTVEDPGARAALLGYEEKPAIMLSEVFGIFETHSANEIKSMSPNQLRRWRNQYKLAIDELIAVVKDKPLTALKHNDVLDYVQYLEDRVAEEELVVKTANRYMGHNSKMIRVANQRFRLGMPSLFSGMRLAGAKNVVRPPYPTEFIQDRILAEGALAGMNDEARRALLVIVETGLRVSEVVNLNETTIHLKPNVPHVEVLPDGRRVKTEDSIRKIPLVGVALEAMRHHPKGFPRYHDNGAAFSGYANEYLMDKGLRPTAKHTVYSLRHSFKDRLIAVEAQDSMIEALMGHKDDHPKYGKGPSLELKQKWLQKIALKPPRSI